MDIFAFVILSFVTISILLVPFINILYRVKFLRQKQVTRDIFEVRTPIFDKLHSHKVGTPVGGGALIIFVVSLLYILISYILPQLGYKQTSLYEYKKEVQILLLTFISFGFLGLYDDIRKMFGLKRAKIWGLRFRHKFLLQLALSGIISALLYFSLGIDFVNVTFFDVFHIGYFYIPFAAFTIVSFTNAVNISDGLDGLATGLLLISLIAFLIISRSILDTTLSLFLGLWIGSLIAFLYFNVWPARIWLGDVGSSSFGATIAVCGLLLGKPIALGIIGGVFIVEVLSSLLQLLSKRIFKKKVFVVSPLHLWLQYIGWPEAKIVSRFWLAQAMFAIIGLWLAFTPL